MQGNRQDAWTNDEDLLLAETVLRFIREGKTQLEAFKEVGKQLSRTSAACGFRWNATLRKQYDDAIQLAKQNRKNIAYQPQLERKTDEQVSQPTIYEVIESLERLQSHYKKIESKEDLRNLEKENEQLKKSLQTYRLFVTKVKDALNALE
ncbi:RsfA family transcriptional regulator [Gracilibacillus sp. S3-1-1]|uniref:RsfA family transcriptional regulator n=1 Tax=Gracilibacillus pellucidus TaxID=3095368 RepID=A0ACC6M207_9BACI|nr:RsfA family transcriptional regulator [Gracilibacillus sp. S3-1-1]MDX8044918.1 RsfA family transcriptional regulator [Gracilibacillus sp. S3-1-1]